MKHFTHRILPIFVVILFPFAGKAQLCPDIVNLTTSIQGIVVVKQAGQYLTSISAVTASKATFKAGSSITLKPGFEVVAGSVFEAEITPCESIETLSNTEDAYNLVAYPNPFNKSVMVEYALPQSGPANIYVTDLKGVVVSKLLSETNHSSGLHHLPANFENLAEGMYIITLDTSLGRKSLRVVKEK